MSTPNTFGEFLDSITDKKVFEFSVIIAVITTIIVLIGSGISYLDGGQSYVCSTERAFDPTLIGDIERLMKEDHLIKPDEKARMAQLLEDIPKACKPINYAEIKKLDENRRWLHKIIDSIPNRRHALREELRLKEIKQKFS